MAIQTHMYQENYVLPNSSQDYFFMENNNNNNNNMLFNSYGLNEFGYNNLQQNFVQQQQHMVQMKGRKSFINEGNMVNLQPSKKQKLVNNQSRAASTITSESDDYLSMDFCKGFSAQLEKQGNEIDRYINLQNEWLKLALHEQRKQQLGAIIKKLEAKAHQLLKQKDEEISQATKKSMELQEIVRKLEFENQSWQRIATQNQEMVFSLNSTLEQLQIQQQQKEEEVCSSSSSSSNGLNDAESCCDKGVLGIKSSKFNADGFQTRAVCKVCNSRNACVLMLPCRHLCSCKVCDAVLDACPVCKAPKKASIDAIIQ